MQLNKINKSQWFNKMLNRYAVKKSGNQRFSTILYRLRRMAGRHP